MFERFTDRARRVVVLAQEEARMLNHNYVGTEHILLGLIHEGEGVAAKALESLGISLEAVRQQVEEIIGRGQQAPSGHIPFTPRAKKVLELSLREALQLGHNYIGTEHILLGLIREGEGVAAQVLVRLGADLNRVRQQTVQILQAYKARSERSGLGEIQEEEEEGEEAVVPRRVVAREFWLTEIQDTLTKITDRLTAIERHLGMTAHPAGRDDAPGSETGEKPKTSSGEKPKASSGDKPRASSRKKPEASSGDKPEASSGDKPEASSGDKPEASSGEKPGDAPGDGEAVAE
jgi:ATP-dependent Clp protease ATP-binding subunit ClpA